MARTVDPVEHRAKRRRILAAALPLFATQGLDGTTTAQIRAAAGVSTGNLFHYFPSKRELFRALLLDDDEPDEDHLADALAEPDPWRGFLGFLDHLAAPAAHEHVPALVLEAMLQATRDPELATALNAQGEDEEAALARLLGRCVEAGRARGDLDVAHTASWVNTLVGALFLRAATAESFDPDTELVTLREVVVRYVGAAST